MTGKEKHVLGHIDAGRIDIFPACHAVPPAEMQRKGGMRHAAHGGQLFSGQLLEIMPVDIFRYKVKTQLIRGVNIGSCQKITVFLPAPEYLSQDPAKISPQDRRIGIVLLRIFLHDLLKQCPQIHLLTLLRQKTAGTRGCADVSQRCMQIHLFFSGTKQDFRIKLYHMIPYPLPPVSVADGMHTSGRKQNHRTGRAGLNDAVNGDSHIPLQQVEKLHIIMPVRRNGQSGRIAVKTECLVRRDDGINVFIQIVHGAPPAAPWSGSGSLCFCRSGCRNLLCRLL